MEAMRFDQFDILRFCRARKFDEAKVKLMLTQFAEWRQNEDIDSLYENWSFPEEPAVKAALPFGIHKHSKEGRPIFIRRVGVCDFDAFFASSTDERIIRHITWQQESYKYHIYPAMS